MWQAFWFSSIAPSLNSWDESSSSAATAECHEANDLPGRRWLRRPDHRHESSPLSDFHEVVSLIWFLQFSDSEVVEYFGRNNSEQGVVALILVSSRSFVHFFLIFFWCSLSSFSADGTEARGSFFAVHISWFSVTWIKTAPGGSVCGTIIMILCADLDCRSYLFPLSPICSQIRLPQCHPRHVLFSPSLTVKVFMIGVLTVNNQNYVCTVYMVIVGTTFP